jgi:hypothetical protein
MAAELTHHGRHGERGKGGAVVGVEALDRLEHAELRHLDQIVDGLTPALEPAGAPQSDPAVLFHERVSHGSIPGAPVLAEASEDRVLVR